MAPSSADTLRERLRELLCATEPDVRDQGIELLRALGDPRLLWSDALRGISLPHTNLTDIDLRSADLRDADLTGADLTGANLRGADLRGATLDGANLTGADLTHVSLSRPPDPFEGLLPALREIIGEMARVAWPFPAALLLFAAVDPLVPIHIGFLCVLLAGWLLLITALSLLALGPIEVIALRHHQLANTRWDQTTRLPAGIYPWLLRSLGQPLG